LAARWVGTQNRLAYGKRGSLFACGRRGYPPPFLPVALLVLVHPPFPPRGRGVFTRGRALAGSTRSLVERISAYGRLQKGQATGWSCSRMVPLTVTGSPLMP